MKRAIAPVVCLVGLITIILASASGAIDSPPGVVDLRAGVDPLAEQFDSEKGRYRLLVLLSPA